MIMRGEASSHMIHGKALQGSVGNFATALPPNTLLPPVLWGVKLTLPPGRNAWQLLLRNNSLIQDLHERKAA
jgi:hypothetical protein